jgi:hypothetical protein
MSCVRGFAHSLLPRVASANEKASVGAGARRGTAQPSAGLHIGLTPRLSPTHEPGRFGEGGVPMHDPPAVGAVIDRGVIRTREMRVDVETRGESPAARQSPPEGYRHSADSPPSAYRGTWPTSGRPLARRAKGAWHCSTPPA